MVTSSRDEPQADEWFVSDDGGQVHISERSVDSDATMAQMGSFDAHFAECRFVCVDPISMWVDGNANDAVREALAAGGPEFLGPFGGFGPR